jgi:hypothetical protein
MLKLVKSKVDPFEAEVEEERDALIQLIEYARSCAQDAGFGTVDPHLKQALRVLQKDIH